MNRHAGYDSPISLSHAGQHVVNGRGSELVGAHPNVGMQQQQPHGSTAMSAMIHQHRTQQDHGSSGGGVIMTAAGSMVTAASEVNSSHHNSCKLGTFW